MDMFAIILRLVEAAPKFIPPPAPPRTDYLSLIEHIPNHAALYESRLASAMPLEVQAVRVVNEEVQPKLLPKDTQKTGCIACSRSHLATVSGGLGEALRFAREGGIQHPESQRRINLAEQEIAIMERIDLAPDALLQSPPEQQELAREYLPHIRELRQDIGAIKSVDELERVAADASVLSQQFRLRHLQLQGVDLNPVMELARQVQAGNMSMDQAKERLKELLPQEA